MRANVSNRIATVFGGTGFVGRYVVRQLAQSGWRIRVAARRPYLAPYLQTMGVVGQVVPIQANVRDLKSITDAVSDADLVVNLVGILFEQGKQTFKNIHVNAAANIAQAAALADARNLVHISAIGADADADSAYLRSKSEGETMVREAFTQAIILRPSVIFGPEDDFINRFARMAMISPFLPLIGGGLTKFQPVFVGDVARAVVNSLNRPAMVYELGGDKIFTFKEIMELLLAELGRKRLLLSMPFTLARIMARITGLLPKPPLTVDQVIALQSDNIVSPAALDDQRTLAGLGIRAKLLTDILAEYAVMYRKGGQFANYNK